MISLEDGKKLIKLARKTVLSALKSSDFPVDNSVKKMFSEKQGVFVTLHLNRQLRGCIGFPTQAYPLWEAVQRAAVAAAFDDPRFHPLSEAEFDSLSFEVSVLTVPEEIRAAPEDIPKHVQILSLIHISEPTRPY